MGCLPVNLMLEKQYLKFIWNFFNSPYYLHKSVGKYSVYSGGSILAENIRYLMYKIMTLALMIGMIPLVMLLIEYVYITLTISLLIMHVLLSMLLLIYVMMREIIIIIHYIYILCICSSKPHLSLRSIIAAGIFTCDGCARDPYFYVPAETQSYVI